MTRPQYIIGIDLGANGGLVLAVRDNHRRTVQGTGKTQLAHATRTPKNHEPEEIVEAVRWAVNVANAPGLRAVLEAPAMVRLPKSAGRRGGQIDPVASAALAKSWGLWRAALAAYSMPCVTVPATTWQAALLKGCQGTSTKQRAEWYALNVLRWPREALIPHRCRVPHDGIIDAGCLASYGFDFADEFAR